MRDASSELLAKLAEGTDFSESRVGCMCVLVRVSGWWVVSSSFEGDGWSH